MARSATSWGPDGVGVLGAAGVDRDIAAGLDDFVQGAAVHRQVLDHFKGHGPEGFDSDGVAVVKMAHVQLAQGGSLFRAMGPAVDHAATLAADPLPAVMVKSDRFFAVEGQLVVDHIQHLQKGHVCGYVLGPVGLEPAFIPGVLSGARLSVSN
jgi:hypothetical protein